MAFAKKGAKVVIADIDADKGKKVVEKIQKDGGKAIFLKADVSDEKAVKKLVKDTVDAFGRLDCAVNNAGVGGEQSTTDQYSIDGWNKVIDINLNGVFYCM